VKKLIHLLIAAAAVTCLLSGIAAAAPSFLNTTGSILTPDDLLLGPGDFSASFHNFDFTDNVSTMGASIGVTNNLELGIARFDPDRAGADEETLLSGKYLLLAETATTPSVVIGVIDATGEIDPDDDSSYYVVLGKNLTPAATGLTGEPVPPIRGFVGIGGGIYNGIFAGLNWTISSRVKVMAEFINELNIKNAIVEDSVFNAGVRIALTNEIRGDLAMINGEDFAFGISYTKLGL